MEEVEKWWFNNGDVFLYILDNILCVFQSHLASRFDLDDLDGLTQKGGKGDCDLFNHDDIVEVFFCYNASTNTGGPLIFHFCGGETPFT